MGSQGRIIVMANRLTKEELHAYEPHAISGFFSQPFDPSTLAAMLLQAIDSIFPSYRNHFEKHDGHHAGPK
jgi:hypothetical protein